MRDGLENVLFFGMALGFAALVFVAVRTIAKIWTVNRLLAALFAALVVAVLLVSWFVSFPYPLPQLGR
ncbi:hypothetical protein X733_13555 [Mesorhizobium sp. L2C067A000]|nr:hypothetical protein X733_13555 [Mesorhizobium sp. L2C067A000]